jgi:hypothetical protein
MLLPHFRVAPLPFLFLLEVYYPSHAQGNPQIREDPPVYQVLWQEDLTDYNHAFVIGLDEVVQVL